MFRFDSIKKSLSPTQNNESAPQHDPLTSTENSPSFLQRIASSDSLFQNKRPNLSKSASSSNVSFSIPMPTNSWGMLVLNRLQDTQDNEFDDIVDLLLSRDKAILLLPVSTPSHSSAIIDRDFIMDHVIVYKDQQDSNQVISLSGIRGLFQKDQFVALGLLPSEKEISDLMTDSPNKKSLFDTFSLDPTSITPDHPKYNILASHVQLPLQKDKLMSVMLIQRPISKKDITEWAEAKAIIIKSISSPLLDPSSSKVNDFIKNFKKSTPKTRDMSSKKVHAFLDDLRDTMKGKSDTEQINERLDVIETYLCNQLYDLLFTNPEGDEAMQDEALESRIAALNLLDLDLKHLGVSVENEEDKQELDKAVKEAGGQLQQLNSIMGAKEKLETLVLTHQIVVDTIERFAERHRNATTLDSDAEVVQEMKQAMSTVNEEEKLNPITSASADVLLPILIFTIVKSNPTNFLSNLKFIQRYRRPEQLYSGQTSYCLTNMMAAVSFLETTNLGGLGLSADKVYSHITDLNATKVVEVNEITKAPQQQQSSGLKIVSDVVDSSYKVFDGIGKFWQRNTQELENNKTMSGLVDQVKGRVKQVSDVAQPILKEGLSELKEIANKNSDGSSVSSLPSFIEERLNKNNTKPSLATNDGPIQKFLDAKSIDELKIGEVAELLADYKRMAAILKQAGLA